MDVSIGTLTSRVTVADEAAPDHDFVERIVALVLARIRDEQASVESARREQEIPPHMSEASRY